MDMICNIADDLMDLAYPVDNLRILPGNSNKGDIGAVAKSLRKFKQRKPIVARRDGDLEIVLAGNTTMQAARDILGWTHIAVSWSDDLDDVNAVGFALADNQTGKLGETDEEALAAQQEFVRQDPDVWEATGFTQDEDSAEAMFRDAVEADEFELDIDDDEDDEPEPFSTPEPTERKAGAPVVQYAIIFDDGPQQQKWFSFLRWLKKEYPDAGTIGARIDAFLDENLPDEDD